MSFQIASAHQNICFPLLLPKKKLKKERSQAARAEPKKEARGFSGLQPLFLLSHATQTIYIDYSTRVEVGGGEERGLGVLLLSSSPWHRGLFLGGLAALAFFPGLPFKVTYDKDMRRTTNFPGLYLVSSMLGVSSGLDICHASWLVFIVLGEITAEAEGCVIQ